LEEGFPGKFQGVFGRLIPKRRAFQGFFPREEGIKAWRKGF